MGDKERVVLYLSEKTAENFRKKVSEIYGQTDGFMSHAGEQALREWADNDRAARIEKKLDDLLTHVPEEELERERDSTVSNGRKTVSDRRHENMVAELPDDAWVSADIVDSVIGKEAGDTYKTLKKYQNRLERNGDILPSPLPNEDKFATSPRKWALQVENDDRIDLTTINSEIGRLEEALGEDWYLEALPDDFIQGRELRYDNIPELSSSDYREENNLTTDTVSFQ